MDLVEQGVPEEDADGVAWQLWPNFCVEHTAKDFVAILYRMQQFSWPYEQRERFDARRIEP